MLLRSVVLGIALLHDHDHFTVGRDWDGAQADVETAHRVRKRAADPQPFGALLVVDGVLVRGQCIEAVGGIGFSSLEGQPLHVSANSGSNV